MYVLLTGLEYFLFSTIITWLHTRMHTRMHTEPFQITHRTILRGKCRNPFSISIMAVMARWFESLNTKVKSRDSWLK